MKQQETNIKTYTSPNEQGYYGKFGGAFIPEMLYRNVEELRSRYLDIIYEPGFQKEYQQLLTDYVGRPTPLYFAERLSKQYKAKIYLKPPDLIRPTWRQLIIARICRDFVILMCEKGYNHITKGNEQGPSQGGYFHESFAAR
ncbi:MAG: hypothetical protein ACXWV9_08180 [Flavisolibacter sp.]